MASPRRITRLIASSAPISQRTGTPAFGMPPPGTSGSGASFDQMTKPSAAGEPEATPSANGSALKTGLAMARDSAASPRNNPVPQPSARITSRRSGVTKARMSIGFRADIPASPVASAQPLQRLVDPRDAVSASARRSRFSSITSSGARPRNPGCRACASCHPCPSRASRARPSGAFSPPRYR